MFIARRVTKFLDNKHWDPSRSCWLEDLEWTYRLLYRLRYHVYSVPLPRPACYLPGNAVNAGEEAEVQNRAGLGASYICFGSAVKNVGDGGGGRAIFLWQTPPPRGQRRSLSR